MLRGGSEPSPIHPAQHPSRFNLKPSNRLRRQFLMASVLPSPAEPPRRHRDLVPLARRPRRFPTSLIRRAADTSLPGTFVRGWRPIENFPARDRQPCRQSRAETLRCRLLSPLAHAHRQICVSLRDRMAGSWSSRRIARRRFRQSRSRVVKHVQNVSVVIGGRFRRSSAFSWMLPRPGGTHTRIKVAVVRIEAVITVNVVDLVIDDFFGDPSSQGVVPIGDALQVSGCRDVCRDRS